MKVVGIDPGTKQIGYAVLEGDPRAIKSMRAETIMIPRCDSNAARLLLLERSLAQRLKRDRPDVVAIEKLFFAKNAKTAIAVAEARGIILLTAERIVHNIWECAPSEVKMAVSGYGRADKEHVRRAILATLPRALVASVMKTDKIIKLGDDAMDAIAIALTAIYARKQHVE